MHNINLKIVKINTIQRIYYQSVFSTIKSMPHSGDHLRKKRAHNGVPGEL